MVATSHGYAPQGKAFHNLLKQIPELYANGMPDWDIIDMDPLLDSSNITVLEWNEIGRVIADHYDAYNGFVVLHGTDTMSYTASALKEAGAVSGYDITTEAAVAKLYYLFSRELNREEICARMERSMRGEITV